jgi:hypothetical protein
MGQAAQPRKSNPYATPRALIPRRILQQPRILD